jgi:uncharacterized membrane protein
MNDEAGKTSRPISSENMKSSRFPILLFVVLYLGFLLLVVFSRLLLPEHVASHFNFSGNPDGWMNRSSYFTFFAIFGFVFPLFVVAICWLARVFPGGINIPHRDYWLAPERNRETFDNLFRQSWWFACLAICFVIGLYFLMIEANHASPPHFSTSGIITLACGFIAGVVVWIVTLIRQFSLRSQ